MFYFFESCGKHKQKTQETKIIINVSLVFLQFLDIAGIDI